MYDATVVATFECVELEIQRQLLLHADLENPKNDINIGGFTKDPKSTKRIIGDMSHTYFANYIDSPSGINKLEDIVADLEEKFPDTHFQITPSKNNFGEIQGAYLRVGATPPTDVPLAAEAIDEILGRNNDESQTQTETDPETG